MSDNDLIGEALFAYSDGDGTAFNGDRAAGCYFGPYLGVPPPPLPVGRRKGARNISYTADDHVGWVYNKADGTVRANTDGDETDAAGKRYSDY